MVVLLDPEEDHDDILRANRSRERKYMFDVVSDARAEQQDVYAATAKILLSSVLEGYNATVFAYGATGKLNLNQLIFFLFSFYKK
jgi:kinesin family protein 18/19